MSNEEEQDVRIHLACDNVFLTLAFSFYLRGHLSNIQMADLVITDRSDFESSLPICRVGKDLIIPCSVYDIFSQLHDFYSKVRVFGDSKYQIDLVEITESNKQDSQTLQQNDIEKLKALQLDPSLSPEIKNMLNDIAFKLSNGIK